MKKSTIPTEQVVNTITTKENETTFDEEFETSAGYKDEHSSSPQPHSAVELNGRPRTVGRKRSADEQPSISVGKSSFSNIGTDTIYQTINHYSCQGRAILARSSSGCQCRSPPHSDDGCPSSGHQLFQMKTILDQRARVESGKTTCPVQSNLQTSRVPLEISSESKTSLQGLDRHGQYNKRSDFEKLMKEPRGDVKLCEIFDCATQKAKTEARSGAKTEAAKQQYIERHGNIVAMIGQAGIGKTTLTRMVLQHIIDGEMLPDTQFLFYIPFRDVDFVNETTLMRFALTGCCDWEHNRESDNKLLKHLKDNPNVVFIFDGLDEANTARLSKHFTHCNITSIQYADTFTAKIFSGDFFPKAKKLLTSRPRQFYELHYDHRPKFVLDILGLNEEAQKILCHQICEESFDIVMTYLESRPEIFACCYVPVNCIITMSIINRTLKKYKTINVKSLTDIFIRALEAFVESEQMRGYNDQVWKISKLAWNGFLEKKIVFEEKDFVNAEIKQDVFQAFLCTYIKGNAKGGIKGKILEGKKKSCFSHLTWQELFVAIYLMMFHPLEEFRDLVEQGKLNDPLWEVVSKFMFGLCNPAVMERLETVLYPKRSVSWCEKTNILCRNIVHSLQEFVLSNQELLRLFSWIREVDDESLNKNVANYIPERFQFPQSPFPTDVANAGYVLKLAVKPLSIYLTRTKMSLHDFKYLCDCFASFPRKIKLLGICVTNVGDKGAIIFSKCMENIEELDFTSLGITAVGVEAIANHLDQCKKTALRLSGREIGDEGALAISKHLSNVDLLKLNKCGITEVGTEKIASQLKKHKLRSLILIGNNIGDKGAISICKCLGHVEELEIQRCSITARGVAEISDRLQRCKIKALGLWSDKFGNEGAISISQCLNNIQELSLVDCGITGAGVEEIAIRLMQRETSIVLLKLRKNKIGHDGAVSISKCLHKIGSLDLSDCHILPGGIEAIANQMRQLYNIAGTKMKALILHSNKFGNEGALSLSKCLDRIDELDIHNCDVTFVGVEAIACQLEQSKMALLNLSSNEIGDRGAAAISKCLNNIDELDLSDGAISSVGSREIACCLKQCQMKTLKLNRNKGVGEEEATSIVECGSELEELQLQSCNLTEDEVKTIKNKLRTSKTVVKL